MYACVAEQLPDPDCGVSATVPVDSGPSCQSTMQVCVSFLPASVKFATTVTGPFTPFGSGGRFALVTTGRALETVTTPVLPDLAPLLSAVSRFASYIPP